MARVAVPVTEVTPPKASLTTSLTGTNNDLVYTARKGGPGGNSIRVQYVDPGAPSQSLSVSMRGFDIIVNLATSGASAITSTAALVKAAVEVAARDLVSVEYASSNDGSGVVTALSITNLTGGSLQTSQPSQTNSDSTNDHYFTDNDENVILEVFNNNVGAQTVTILYSPTYAPIATVAGQSESIPAAGTRYLGPFEKAAFNQNEDGDVYFDPSVSTDLKFRALRGRTRV